MSSTALRFEFGKNWTRFLSALDDQRITEAGRSLQEMLGAETLRGATFLDVGSGSGLFSLAAMRLGAAKVHSFDFDPACVACTIELRNRYYPESPRWTAEKGSAVDGAYLASLGRFDIVYAWGVLHHTGAMHQALDLVAEAVAPGGHLFIAIYNDQGWRSRAWLRIKKAYNSAPRFARPLFVLGYLAPREVAAAGLSVMSGHPQRYLDRWKGYKQLRGMSRLYDAIDWVGGYPFEVASPEEIFELFKERGFALERLVTRSVGCNEYVFVRLVRISGDPTGFADPKPLVAGARDGAGRRLCDG